MAKTSKRKTIGLVCAACTQRHYYTRKNPRNTPDKIELVKYCSVIRKKAPQKETSKNLGRNVVKARKK